MADGKPKRVMAAKTYAHHMEPTAAVIFLVSLLTALSRLVRSVQYAGLLPLQPASTTIPITQAQARRTDRVQAPP